MPNFNEVMTSTVYCGVKVTMNFKGGNIVNGKSARLQTDNPFAQDAIEHDQRFLWGNIKLVNVVEINDTTDEKKGSEGVDAAAETAEDAKPKKGKKTAKSADTGDKQVVEDVKTLNDLDAWFAEQGVTLEGSSKSYINGLCEKYNVIFPNLKY